MITLDSIDAQKSVDPHSVEVIVVANGCTDATIAQVTARISDCPFSLRIVDEQQLGLPSARNRSVREAKNEILAFIDDDVVLSEHYLNAMQRMYEKFPADIAGGKTELLWEAVERPDWLPDSLLNLFSCVDLGDAPKEVFSRSAAIGCNFSFRQEVANSVGDFKLSLGRSGKLLIGGEEADYIARALRKGFKMYYFPQCYLQHWVAPNRPTLKYLKGVAQGNATGFIFAKPESGMVKKIKWTFLYSFNFFKHSLKECLYFLTGNKKQRVFHKIKKHSQIGFLKGVLHLALGRVNND